MTKTIKRAFYFQADYVSCVHCQHCYSATKLPNGRVSFEYVDGKPVRTFCHKLDVPVNPDDVYRCWRVAEHCGYWLPDGLEREAINQRCDRHVSLSNPGDHDPLSSKE